MGLTSQKEQSKLMVQYYGEQHSSAGRNQTCDLRIAGFNFINGAGFESLYFQCLVNERIQKSSSYNVILVINVFHKGPYEPHSRSNWTQGGP